MRTYKKNINKYIMAILITALNLFDAVMTTYEIAFGLAEEANPIINFIINNYNLNLIFVKLVISLLFSVIIITTWDKFKITKVGSLIVFIVYFLLAGYHMFNIFYL